MTKNPFENIDKDRSAIWEMLVDRDIHAFCSGDWSMVANDFIESGFMGLDGGKVPDPDTWTVGFPDLKTYKEEWLSQARDFINTAWKDEDPKKVFFELTNLTQIDIIGDAAIAHKKFDGVLTKKDGEKVVLNWQTLYQCRKVGDVWKIAGFVGYLPYPLGTQQKVVTRKMVPAGAGQHKTAGPYSPVLEVDVNKLVVISGQAPLDLEGNVIGDQIEKQTEVTLQNCQKQLATAGCTFADVFKVNVFLKDLADWPRFNEVYASYFPDPKPVRTAVQTPLLMTFLVEIEMWAVKS